MAAPPLCGLCRARLPRLPSPRCVRCAEPLGNPFAALTATDRCGTCESWSPALQTVDAPFAYQTGAAQLVRAFKYQGWRSIADVMAPAMDPALRLVTNRLSGGRRPPLLIPVPLSPSRMRARGFNQAEDLAVGLADHGLGEACLALRREDGGTHQAEIGAEMRRHNVRGRFQATIAAIDPERPLVIVDDVLTTGSTLLECSEALAEAGFRRIGAVTFARTLRPLDADRTETTPAQSRQG